MPGQVNTSGWTWRPSPDGDEAEELVERIDEKLQREGSVSYGEFVELVKASYTSETAYHVISRILSEAEEFTVSFKVRVGEDSYRLLEKLARDPGGLGIDKTAVKGMPGPSGYVGTVYFGVVARRTGSLELFVGETGVAGLRTHTYDEARPPMMMRLLLGDSEVRGLSGDTPILPLKRFLEVVEPGEEVGIIIDLKGEREWWWPILPSLEGALVRGRASGHVGEKVRSLVEFHEETVKGINSLSITPGRVLVGSSPVPCNCGLVPWTRIEADTAGYTARLIRELTLSARGGYTVDTLITGSLARVAVSPDNSPFRLEMIGWRLDSNPSWRSARASSDETGMYLEQAVAYVRVPDNYLSLDMDPSLEAYTRRDAFITGALLRKNYGVLLALAVISRGTGNISLLAFPVENGEDERLLDGKILVYPSCKCWFCDHCLEPVYTSSVGGELPVYEWSLVPAEGEASVIPRLLSSILSMVSENAVVVRNGSLRREDDYAEHAEVEGGVVWIEKKGRRLEARYTMSEPVYFENKVSIEHWRGDDVEYTVSLAPGVYEFTGREGGRVERVQVYYPVITLYAPGSVLIKTSSGLARTNTIPILEKLTAKVKNKWGRISSYYAPFFSQGGRY